MTDVENAWDRYQGAKTALLTSLSSEFNTPPPILSLAPSERLFYRENAHRSVQNMSAFCQRIQTTIDELHHFKQAMTHYIGQATLSLVPISAIPFEILCSIFAYAVDGPGDANSILQLSHVSRTWRTVALETSELFTHADWNHWNVALVHLWNEKAKHHPLSITIDATTFRALFYTKGHAQIETEKKRAFHAALPRCASLSLTIEGPKTSDIQTPIFHPIPMFAPRCTRLQDLSITYTGGLLSLDLSGFTTVKHLHLHRVIEAFTREMEIESFVCATDATGFFYDTLRFLPHLRSLSICQLVVDVVLAGTSIVHLDALERLEIRQLPQARATVLLLLLAQMKTPNVEHLTLNGLSLSKIEESQFWHQVGESMPQIRSLTLKQDQAGDYPLSLYFAELRDRAQPPLLANLHEIHMIGSNIGHLLYPIYGFVFVRKGDYGIHQITLPPREEFDGHDLKFWDKLCKLVPSFKVGSIANEPWAPLRSFKPMKFIPESTNDLI